MFVLINIHTTRPVDGILRGDVWQRLPCTAKICAKRCWSVVARPGDSPQRAMSPPCAPCCTFAVMAARRENLVPAERPVGLLHDRADEAPACGSSGTDEPISASALGRRVAPSHRPCFLPPDAGACGRGGYRQWQARWPSRSCYGATATLLSQPATPGA